MHSPSPSPEKESSDLKPEEVSNPQEILHAHEIAQGIELARSKSKKGDVEAQIMHTRALLDAQQESSS